jgi:hypothetical protein
MSGEQNTHQRNVDQILSKINEVASSSMRLTEVSGQYQVARDLFHKDLNDDVNAKKMQVMMDVLNFVIKDGTLVSCMSGTTGDGKPFEYPDLKNFDEKSFKLIEGELNSTKISILKARYADFLWITKKDYKKAQIAVDAYLKLVKEYEVRDKSDSGQHFGLDVLHSFERAFQLAYSIKYRKEDVLRELERLLFKFNPCSTSKSKLAIDLVRIAFDKRKEIGDRKLWKKIIILCEERSEILNDEKSFSFSRSYLHQAKKIDGFILNGDIDKWNNLIAESYVAQAGDCRKGKNFAELHFLLKAIDMYTQMKNVKKIEELKKQYKKSSKFVQFNQIETKIDISDFIKSAKDRAKRIKKLKQEEIIYFLSASPYFFPSHKQVEDMAKIIEEKSVFWQIMGNVSVFDKNMNQTKDYLSDEDKKSLAILENFGRAMSIHQHEIDIFLLEIIGKKYLKWNDLAKFLRKYSWLGMWFELKDGDGEVILRSRKIMDLISPGLKKYFSIVQKIANNKKVPQKDVILATDSLVLKIEGMIREIYHLLGKSTTTVSGTKGGGNVISEKSINDFLNDDFIESVFGKDLVLVMKCFLTEQIGLNLRNNVAHCFLQKEEYSISKLHVLFLILIRLGGYKLEKKSNHSECENGKK